MSGLDKIIEHIESSATETAATILKNAKAEAEKIRTEGKAAADTRVAAISHQGEIDGNAAIKRLQSEADLAEKRYILNSKQESINDAFAGALDRILRHYSQEEYFSLILRMIKKYASAQEGVIKFSGADLKRMPAGFEQQINQAAGKGHLSVSDEAVDISGGFILDYGVTLENCSFDSLFADLREELQDKVGQVLFG